MTDSTLAAHQLTSQVKFLHKVAVICLDQALILQRSNHAQSRPGKWDLAGGNCEWPTGLTTDAINLHRDDIQREIEEETGLKVPAANFDLTNLVYLASYFEVSRQLYSINCGWRAKLELSALPAIKISAEHQAYRWIKLAELPAIDFGPDRNYEPLTIERALTGEIKC